MYEGEMKLQGIYPILATPFLPNGNIDEKGFEQLLVFLVDSGVHGLTLFGLAGEYYKLADAERETLRSLFLRRTAGRLTRIVSVTDHSLELACRRAREAADQGAEALMIMPPFFLSPDLNSVWNHIKEIAQAVQVPILVQYSPNQTGLHLPVRFFIDLVERFPHVHHVKVDSTPAGPMISNLTSESNSRIQPFIGYAGLQMVDGFARGAVGCMPGCSLPEPYLGIYAALTRNDFRAAGEQHARLLPLINFMMQSLEFVIQCEKTILWWRGVIGCNYCRWPKAQLAEHDLRVLRKLLESSAPLVTESVSRSTTDATTAG